MISKSILHPQLHQLINLILLLVLGKYFAYVYLPWMHIFLVLITALLVEHLFIFLKQAKLNYFSYSSLSTAIGIILMMVTFKIWILLIVIILGLAQKHFLKFGGRHFFNPSNFALLMGLLLFYSDAHLVLGQLGNNIYCELIILLAAGFILYRVNRWILPLVFSFCYLVLQYFLIVNYDPVLIMDEIFYRFYSVSFIVFIVFMLTDPLTTPSKIWQQCLFALILAVVAVSFDRIYGFRVQHMFMALFLLTPLAVFGVEWYKTLHRRKLIIFTSLLFISAVSIVMFIQGKPPYYFEMSH